jgi:hypothetical protein
MHDPRRVDQKSTDRANDRLAVSPVKELSELGNDLDAIPATASTSSCNQKSFRSDDFRDGQL